MKQLAIEFCGNCCFELTIRLLCTQEESTITRKLRMLRKSEQLEFQMPRPQGETMESKSTDHVMIHELTMFCLTRTRNHTWYCSQSVFSSGGLHLPRLKDSSCPTELKKDMVLDVDHFASGCGLSFPHGSLPSKSVEGKFYWRCAG